MMREALKRDSAIAAIQLSKEKKYWLEKLSGELVKSSFPADFIESDTYEKNTSSMAFKITGAQFLNLLKLCNGSDARLHMILSTVLVVLINKYTGHKNIMIGTPIYQQNTQKDFINTVLILRNQINGDHTFKQTLLHFRKTLNEAVEHQNYPVSKLLYDLGKGYSGGSFPLFDIAIMLENIHEKAYFKDIQLNVLFSFLKTGESIEGRIEFNQKLYKSDTMANIAAHFINLLEVVLNNIEVAIKDIAILSEQEKNELLYRYNNTNTAYPSDKTISELFEEQVEKTPDNIAVVFKDKRLTYKELNERANRLARRLRDMGVKPDTIVGIMAERSVEMLLGILAILKAGGAYLPIDTEYPEERILYILEDSKADILLTQRHLVQKIKFDGKILALDKGDLYEDNGTNLDKISTPSNLAYVIYTSGSTGNPKGVMIANRGLVNYIWWAQKVYLNGEQLDFPLYSSISFDLTVTSIFTPLISGSSIIIYGEEDKTLLIRKIAEKDEVGIIKLTPVHLGLLKDLDLSKTQIKKFIVGGEDLKTKLASAIHDCSGGKIEIYNEYGPTETVVGCMIYKYDDKKDVRSSVPVGVPADNVKIYLLDPDLKLVPKGVIGEMYISGDGVAKGYVNRPALTAEKFIDNPFILGERMYKTGDLARMLPDGNIEFIGRADNQVKIRGYRIELGEIENRLLSYGPIKEAIVVVREDENRNKYLSAYIVASKEVTVEELREHLAKNLPQYMVPSYYVQLEKMPLTSNGKIDRKSLLEINKNIAAKTAYEAPSNEIEERITKIWRDELLVKKIGINDNFFAMGGNSIKAMLIAEKINEALNIQLQVIDIFDKPTIKELAESVLNINSSKYKPVMRLSSGGERNIFLFPPMAGLGIAYKDLASFIKSFTVYAFDFIEHENRIEAYIDLMTDIQREGPYLLMAFSSGGILLFDVAKALEKRGYEVSDIILLDCIASKKIFSEHERETLIDQEIGALKEAMLLKYPSRWKYVEASIERRIRVYLNYISRFDNTAKINANIYQILCSDKNLDRQTLNNKKKWVDMTNKLFVTYQGVGKHIEMMIKYLDKNMEIVTDILEQKA